MRLWDRLIRRDGYWEGMASGAAVLTTTYGSPDRETILPQLSAWAQQANGGDSVVFSAIAARMLLFSEAQFTLQRPTDRGVFTDQRLAIVQRPWPRGTEGELLARMEQDVCVAGNAYIWNAGERLVRLRPDWTTIVSQLVYAPGGGVYREKVGYWVEPPKSVLGHGQGEFYPADEVAHWAPIPDPAADFRGMSWLTPVYRDIRGDTALTDYKLKYLQNAASPNILIRYSQKLQPGTIDAVRERMQARYGGVDNAFKTLVLDQGADATVIGNSLSQMNFDVVQQAGAERILSAAGVPPLVVGLEPIRGAGKSYEEVIRRFADLTMRPEWRSCCAVLQPIVPGVDPPIRLWVDTGDIAALQEGEQVRAQVTLIRSQALLTLTQAGYTRDSAVSAVEAGDMSQLTPEPAPAPVPVAAQTQHLLPQAPGSGPAVAPLPAGSTPRLPVGTTSVADGGNKTRPTRRPASVRRGLNGNTEN